MSMKTKEQNREQFALVGYLQIFAKSPFASVYLDRESRTLFLLVRVNSLKDATPIYAATQTTAEKLTKYLNRRIVLRTMFPQKDYTYVRMKDGRAISTTFTDGKHVRERLKRAGRFEPELCHSRVEIENFLNSL